MVIFLNDYTCLNLFVALLICPLFSSAFVRGDVHILSPSPQKSPRTLNPVGTVPIPGGF